MTKNVMIVGVGGQGSLLASKLLGYLLLNEGYDVKVSEVHGMSQRGGSVVTYVRFGSRVFSSVIEKGEADIILSFEQLESARWLPYLKKGGVLMLEIGFDQKEAVKSLLQETGRFEKIIGLTDLTGKDRIICAVLSKNSQKTA